MQIIYMVGECLKNYLEIAFDGKKTYKKIYKKFIKKYNDYTN